MTKQLMIYERAVPVSSERHRDWSVRMGKNFGFARNVNSVPLLAVEFLPATSDYSIVFAGDDQNVFPTVILGMGQNENAYVAEDGSWTGGYIPAFLRRYPFVFSRSDDGDTFTLCLDEEFEDFNKDGRGERLFDADGNRTQFLESMLTFTREYQNLFDRTSLFCKRLLENDLLEPATAQFNLADGEQRSLTGFLTISREKLKALDAEKLTEMARTDELELCYAHLHSLRNLTPMAQKAASETSGSSGGDGDGENAKDAETAVH
ncbi:MAG: SapC family protein [Paracoccaceae bacterium]